MDHPSDRELVQGILASDGEAYRTLFYRYYEPLFGFCYRRLGSRAEAEDVAQDVFVRAWETRSRLDPDRPIRAYLYRLASNRIIDVFRASAVRRTHDQPGESLSVDPDAEFFAVQEDVREALAALPEHLRKTFVLSRYDGLRYAEIAALLDISVKAVEKRMSHALRELRTRLAHLLSLLVTFFGGLW